MSAEEIIRRSKLTLAVAVAQSLDQAKRDGLKTTGIILAPGALQEAFGEKIAAANLPSAHFFGLPVFESPHVKPGKAFLFGGNPPEWLTEKDLYVEPGSSVSGYIQRQANRHRRELGLELVDYRAEALEKTKKRALVGFREIKRGRPGGQDRAPVVQLRLPGLGRLAVTGNVTVTEAEQHAIRRAIEEGSDRWPYFLTKEEKAAIPDWALEWKDQ